MTSAPDRRRLIWLALTATILVFAAVELVLLYRVIDGQRAVGVDLDYFKFVAQRWLDTGVFFTDRQLAGPYEQTTLIDNLYPPHALYLFIPFLVLPTILWWVLPLGFIGYVVWWCRPAPWSWPILALIVLLPKTFNQVIYGNTDMWIVAFIAGGVRWGWPATLVTIKPSLLPFAVLGIASRAWWVAAAALAVLSLPFLQLWLQWPTAILNSTAGASYSLSNLPFFVLPVVAWLGSTRRGATPWRSWGMRLFGVMPDEG